MALLVKNEVWSLEMGVLGSSYIYKDESQQNILPFEPMCLTHYPLANCLWIVLASG